MGIAIIAGVFTLAGVALATGLEWLRSGLAARRAARLRREELVVDAAHACIQLLTDLHKWRQRGQGMARYHLESLFYRAYAKAIRRELTASFAAVEEILLSPSLPRSIRAVPAGARPDAAPGRRLLDAIEALAGFSLTEPENVWETRQQEVFDAFGEFSEAVTYRHIRYDFSKRELEVTEEESRGR
ncbi:MAG: hypothetical protein ACLP8X_01795 [Streptosporangiaceae bacterium]